MCLSLPRMLGRQGAVEERQTKLRLRRSAGGWDSACPSLSFWGREKHVHSTSLQEQGHWRRHARETCCRKFRF